MQRKRKRVKGKLGKYVPKTTSESQRRKVVFPKPPLVQ